MLEYQLAGSELIQAKEIFAVDVSTALSRLKRQVGLVHEQNIAVTAMYWVSTNGRLVSISSKEIGGIVTTRVPKPEQRQN